MVPQLEQCCCGCELRTGSKFVGWIGAIFGTILFIIFLLTTIGLFAYADQIDPKKAPKEAVLAAEIILIVTTALSLLRALFSISLLIGAYQEKISYYLPWIIYTTVALVLEFIILISSIFTGNTEAINIIRNFVTLCVDVYFVLVVYSDYRQQKERCRGGC